ALPDVWFRQVLPRFDDIGERTHVFGDPRGRRLGVDGALELPLAEEREHPRHHETCDEHADPASPQHDLAKGRREFLRCRHDVRDTPQDRGYGASTTSTRWNSLRSEYPVVA